MLCYFSTSTNLKKISRNHVILVHAHLDPTIHRSPEKKGKRLYIGDVVHKNHKILKDLWLAKWAK